MKFRVFMSLIAVIAITNSGFSYAKSSSEEKVEIKPILNAEEVNQHQQLALSLRNQKLLEQQAESRAKQLLFQLQAAEAWAAIQRLGVKVNAVSNTEVEGTTVAEIYSAEREEVSGYRILAMIKQGDQWIAKIGNDHQVFTVHDGREFKPGVEARIQRNRVRLIGKGWQHEIAM
ncbi:hypothetical protein CWE08_05975 [Aliidiomarina iranensis]|uniref:Type IV pilus biogenesis protein PilP n=1 Tax=Aliidiomarina iranensis TaxID=1434071 RepID=A0A432VX11_9GAMM|nr:hypothetical protein [Aliidiomarina iranensis]RUO21138.1 hypothetical protein CWE08_05975 [Aliidiomarina iranensis]